MTDYRGFEDPSGPGRHARHAGSEIGARPASGAPAPWPETEVGAMNAGGMTAQNRPGARMLSVPKIWLIGFVGLL